MRTTNLTLTLQELDMLLNLLATHGSVYGSYASALADRVRDEQTNLSTLPPTGGTVRKAPAFDKVAARRQYVASGGNRRQYEPNAAELRAVVAGNVTGAELLALNKKPVEMKTVTNLMSGKEIQIAADTPRSCDPSTELYWSM